MNPYTTAAAATPVATAEAADSTSTVFAAAAAAYATAAGADALTAADGAAYVTALGGHFPAAVGARVGELVTACKPTDPDPGPCAIADGCGDNAAPAAMP